MYIEIVEFGGWWDLWEIWEECVVARSFGSRSGQYIAGMLAKWLLLAHALKTATRVCWLNWWLLYRGHCERVWWVPYPKLRKDQDEDDEDAKANSTSFAFICYSSHHVLHPRQIFRLARSSRSPQANHTKLPRHDRCRTRRCLHLRHHWRVVSGAAAGSISFAVLMARSPRNDCAADSCVLLQR